MVESDPYPRRQVLLLGEIFELCGALQRQRRLTPEEFGRLFFVARVLKLRESDPFDAVEFPALTVFLEQKRPTTVEDVVRDLNFLFGQVQRHVYRADIRSFHDPKFPF